MTRVRAILIVIVVGACVWIIKEMLDPNMRGPRGYYVQKDDPQNYIEFFAKPKARSNVVREFGDAEYSFSAFDSEINLYGPLTAPPETRRRFEVFGDGTEIRIQELESSQRFSPVTRYVRKSK